MAFLFPKKSFSICWLYVLFFFSFSEAFAAPRVQVFGEKLDGKSNHSTLNLVLKQTPNFGAALELGSRSLGYEGCDHVSVQTYPDRTEIKCRWRKQLVRVSIANSSDESWVELKPKGQAAIRKIIETKKNEQAGVIHLESVLNRGTERRMVEVVGTLDLSGGVMSIPKIRTTIAKLFNYSADSNKPTGFQWIVLTWHASFSSVSDKEAHASSAQVIIPRKAAPSVDQSSLFDINLVWSAPNHEGYVSSVSTKDGFSAGLQSAHYVQYGTIYESEPDPDPYSFSGTRTYPVGEGWRSHGAASYFFLNTPLYESEEIHLHDIFSKFLCEQKLVNP